MTKKIGIAVLVAVALVTTVRGAEKPAALAGKTDWSQWRGPNRNGIAPDSPKLADAWGPDGPVQLWKSEEKIVGGPKKGGGFSNYGSPVVAKGKVYLYVHDQAGASDLVYCLDANTGKKLWKASYPGSPDGGGSSTPYVGGGKVYAVGTRGMYCLDAETGKEIWKAASLVVDAKGDGINSSPAIVDGVLVVCAGSDKHLNPNAVQLKESGVLKGFDPATGKELWSCPKATADANLNGDKSTSVAVWNTAKGPRLITGMGKLTCVNPKDGSVIWQDAGDVYGSASTPAILGDLCVLGTTLKAYRLGLTKAEELFPGQRGLGDRCGSYLLHDNHIYADCAGTYRCFDLTGKVLWQKSAGGMISSPVLADGKIFHIVSSKEESKVKLAMFSATPTIPATFFQVSVSALHYTSPAICGGRLYVRLVDGLACYDLTKLPADAIIVSKPPAPAASASAPTAKELVTFVDVSPSYHVFRKGIKDQVWPPEKEEEAANLDWAFNQPLDANGTIDFVPALDARGMLSRDCVVYARVVLEAAVPGKVALSLTSVDRGVEVVALAVWINGRNILRRDAHEKNPVHEDLVVDLAKGRNTLLVRDNSSGGQWKLQIQAKPLDGLVVKQVQAAPARVGAPVR